MSDESGGAAYRSVVRDSQALFRSNFERVAELPLSWRLTADMLLRAARTLLPAIDGDQEALLDPLREEFESSVVPVYMMLAGLAIENLVKAKLIETRFNSPTDRDRLVKELRSHRLLNLLNEAGVSLTDDEAYLVERLQVFVEWAGRYPIPLSVHDALPRTAPSGGWGPLNVFLGSDVEAIEALVARLKETSKT